MERELNGARKYFKPGDRMGTSMSIVSNYRYLKNYMGGCLGSPILKSRYNGTTQNLTDQIKTVGGRALSSCFNYLKLAFTFATQKTLANILGSKIVEKNGDHPGDSLRANTSCSNIISEDTKCSKDWSGLVG